MYRFSPFILLDEQLTLNIIQGVPYARDQKTTKILFGSWKRTRPNLTYNQKKLSFIVRY